MLTIVFVGNDKYVISLTLYTELILDLPINIEYLLQQALHELIFNIMRVTSMGAMHLAVS